MLWVTVGVVWKENTSFIKLLTTRFVDYLRTCIHMVFFSKQQHLFSIVPDEERVPREKVQRPASFFRALCLSCLVAPRASN